MKIDADQTSVKDGNVSISSDQMTNSMTSVAAAMEQASTNRQKAFDDMKADGTYDALLKKIPGIRTGETDWIFSFMSLPIFCS